MVCQTKARAGWLAEDAVCGRVVGALGGRDGTGVVQAQPRKDLSGTGALQDPIPIVLLQHPPGSPWTYVRLNSWYKTHWSLGGPCGCCMLWVVREWDWAVSLPFHTPHMKLVGGTK